MRKSLVLVLTFAIVSSVASAATSAKTRRRHVAKRHHISRKVPAQPSATALKTAAALKLARDRVTAEIKTLNHFLYLFGGIAKGIEAADLAARTREASSTAAINQGEQNKARVRENVRNVRQGLEKLESDLRADPALRGYYQYVVGVGDIGAAAENQAAANRFDEAGKTLLKAVDRLTDALANMR